LRKRRVDVFPVGAAFCFSAFPFACRNFFAFVAAIGKIFRRAANRFPFLPFDFAARRRPSFDVRQSRVPLKFCNQRKNVSHWAPPIFSENSLEPRFKSSAAPRTSSAKRRARLVPPRKPPGKNSLTTFSRLETVERRQLDASAVADVPNVEPNSEPNVESNKVFFFERVAEAAEKLNPFAKPDDGLSDEDRAFLELLDLDEKADEPHAPKFGFFNVAQFFKSRSENDRELLSDPDYEAKKRPPLPLRVLNSAIERSLDWEFAERFGPVSLTSRLVKRQDTVSSSARFKVWTEARFRIFKFGSK
jgi:hypothetical protein